VKLQIEKQNENKVYKKLKEFSNLIEYQFNGKNHFFGLFMISLEEKPYKFLMNLMFTEDIFLVTIKIKEKINCLFEEMIKKRLEEFFLKFIQHYFIFSD